MMFQNDSTLLEVLQEIMTEMFFIFPDLDDEGSPDQFLEIFNADYYTNISYGNGDFLFFEWDKRLLSNMAANFLGTDPYEIKDSQMLSVAQEATNVIGGRYLVLVDPGKNRSLSLPQLLGKNDIELFKAQSPKIRAGFISDQQGLFVSAYHLE